MHYVMHYVMQLCNAPAALELLEQLEEAVRRAGPGRDVRGVLSDAHRLCVSRPVVSGEL